MKVYAGYRERYENSSIQIYLKYGGNVSKRYYLLYASLYLFMSVINDGLNDRARHSTAV